MKAYFTLNTENMKMLPMYLITSGVDFNERHMDRPEGFSEYLLLVTKEGEGLIEYNGQSVSLKPGQILFVPPWVPHKYWKVSEDWVTEWISFDGNELKALFESQIPLEIHIVESGPRTVINDRLVKIYKLTEADYQKNAIKISSMIYEMIAEVIGRIQGRLNDVEAKTAYVEKVIAYMNQHYSEDISIDTMANHVGISPQYMCRLFKQQMSVRPFEYLRQVRINKSKSLLIQRKVLKIEAIASAVGFNNPSYYGAIFKQYEKMTPKAFMKQHQRRL